MIFSRCPLPPFFLSDKANPIKGRDQTWCNSCMGKMEGISTKKNVDYFGWIILLIWTGRLPLTVTVGSFPQISFLIPYTLWKGNENMFLEIHGIHTSSPFFTEIQGYQPPQNATFHAGNNQWVIHHRLVPGAGYYGFISRGWGWHCGGGWAP